MKLSEEQEMFRKLQQEQTANAVNSAYLGDTCQNMAYRPTERERAEKNVGYHREQAEKADQAAAFFREHPEFDEFIRLIRDGIISI